MSLVVDTADNLPPPLSLSVYLYVCCAKVSKHSDSW